MIISAGGDIDYFEQVKVLVASAPMFDNWNIIAFKPPVSENFKIRYEGILLDTEKIWYRTSRGENNKFDIFLFIEDYDDKSIEAYSSASHIILETKLGEQNFYKKIGSNNVQGSYISNLEDLYELKFLNDLLLK